jgi:threonine dehydrogenase-like Zn-dependent dehydrogenase
MRAVCWCGKKEIRVLNVPDPEILNPHDAIVKVTLTSICGADVHLYDGYIPNMEAGDILGHEFVGEVVDIGSGVNNLRKGDRVVVPFTISCGKCRFCQSHQWSLCDNSNPNTVLAQKYFGFSSAGIFGYSHLFGGYAGGQAEYVRVPFADVGPFRIPGGLSDEQVLFLSDIFPTGYQAAEVCNIEPGDTVAVWGCGPVGQFAIKSAFLLGAERVIAIDHFPDRLEMAATASGAEPVNFDHVEDVFERLRDMTGGRGPDACIDAVGMESHGVSADAIYDRVRAAAYLATDRPHALREAIQACRKGGTVSIPGFYAGYLDRFPLGQAFAKGLTLRMGQTHVQRYIAPLMDYVLEGTIDPTFVITHRSMLEEAPEMYRTFAEREDNCIKVVMRP